jgi:hypothetical protein
MDLIVVRYSEEWVSASSHSTVEGEWPVVVRTPPLFEKEAPFQNTYKSRKNKNMVMGPDGVRC